MSARNLAWVFSVYFSESNVWRFLSDAAEHFAIAFPPFSQELELLPPKQIQDSIYIRCPVALEQVRLKAVTSIASLNSTPWQADIHLTCFSTELNWSRIAVIFKWANIVGMGLIYVISSIFHFCWYHIIPFDVDISYSSAYSY